MARRRCLVGLAVGVGVTCATLATITLPAPLAAAANGLAVDATTTYEVDFPAGLVRVRLDLSVENTVAPDRDGGGVRSTYFTGWQVGVHGDATALAGQAGDEPVALSLEPVDAELQLLSITFPERLDYGERQDLVVTWDLPGLPPRSDSPWRTNEAFAAFVAYAYGDPGTAAVRVVSPVEVDVSLPALGLTSLEEPIVSTDGVVDVRAFEAIAEPTFFAPVVIASDGAGLTETTLDVAGRDVVVQAWPDDPEWTAFMGGQVGTALSDLEQLIGFPARDDRAVIVRESVEPILEGFAGWFDQDTGVIEVGEDLDPALVFHEVGHAWFNDDFAPSRWINEGLAETYANLLLERTGAIARQPIVPTAGAPGAQPLSEWNFPVTLPPDADSERYGYETSHFVVDALVDEVGFDAMADVLTAMERDVEAYRGDGEPQPTTAAADWRRLLDLASELGHAETAAELFRTWVAPAGDVGDFELRSTARQRYDTLVTDGDGWAAPLAVRQAMERWEFDAAAFAMTAAEAALSARRQLDAAAAPTQIALPAQFEEQYETATSERDLNALAAEQRELADAIDSLSQATAAHAAAQPPLAALGLRGRQYGVQLEAAREAVAAGDAATAQAISGEVREGLAGAAESGRARAATLADTGITWWWVAGLAGLAAVALAIVADRLRSRRVVAQVDPAGDAAVDGHVELGVDRRIDLDEDALTGARLSGVDDGLDVADRDQGQ